MGRCYSTVTLFGEIARLIDIAAELDGEELEGDDGLDRADEIGD